jgi:hypothetical protein
VRARQRRFSLRARPPATRKGKERILSRTRPAKSNPPRDRSQKNRVRKISGSYLSDPIFLTFLLRDEKVLTTPGAASRNQRDLTTDGTDGTDKKGLVFHPCHPWLTNLAVAPPSRRRKKKLNYLE